MGASPGDRPDHSVPGTEFGRGSHWHAFRPEPGASTCDIQHDHDTHPHAHGLPPDLPPELTALIDSIVDGAFGPDQGDEDDESETFVSAITRGQTYLNHVVIIRKTPNRYEVCSYRGQILGVFEDIESALHAAEIYLDAYMEGYDDGLTGSTPTSDAAKSRSPGQRPRRPRRHDPGHPDGDASPNPGQR